MTTTFAVLMGVIFLMEIGAGIAAYKLKGQVIRKYSDEDFRKPLHLFLKYNYCHLMSYSLSGWLVCFWQTMATCVFL